jgi:hypothetical protein
MHVLYEMGEECSMHGKGEKCIQNVGLKTRREVH